MQTVAFNLLIDPAWSKRAFSLSFAGPKRVNDPGIPFEALPRIDAVLVSHAHDDHLDLATLLRLVNTHRRRVITPLGNDVIMREHGPGQPEAGTTVQAFVVAALSLRSRMIKGFQADCRGDRRAYGNSLRPAARPPDIFRTLRLHHTPFAKATCWFNSRNLARRWA